MVSSRIKEWIFLWFQINTGRKWGIMDQRMRANPWDVTPGADASICVSRTNPFLYCCWVLGAVFFVCLFLGFFLFFLCVCVINCLLSPFHRWGRGVQELYKKLIKFPQLLRNRQGDKPRHSIPWVHALKCYLLIDYFVSVSLMSHFTMSVKYVTTWKSIQQLKSLFFKLLLIWIDLVPRLNSQKLFSTKCNLKSQFFKMPSRVLCVSLCLSGNKDIIRTFTHFSFISWG